jgi:ATPase subunit of ABC transporter with duplicated ATPase domains
MLRAAGIAKSLAYRTLFREISLSIERGDRLGIVGPNGAGKSTLLKILSGSMDADKGELSVDPRVRSVLVSQLDRFDPGQTARGVVTAAGLRLADERGEHIEAHEAEVTGDIILGKTGFPSELCDADASTLSGGWRKRLAIAAGLASARDEPDLLFLDEPTNHLDIEGIRWLEQLVLRIASRGSGAAVAFVTHDRTFLERVSTRVAELSPMYPERAAGCGRELLRVSAPKAGVSCGAVRASAVARGARAQGHRLALAGPAGAGNQGQGTDRLEPRAHGELAELEERSDAAAERRLEARLQRGQAQDAQDADRRGRELCARGQAALHRCRLQHRRGRPAGPARTQRQRQDHAYPRAHRPAHPG